MTDLLLTVSDVQDETASIRRLVFSGSDTLQLPGFAAGAHISLALPGLGQRKYSLINADPQAARDAAPRHYVIGVRLDAEGGGGSRAMHAMKVGDTILSAPPQSNFALKDGAAPVALVAGGIGVTPLISMAATLQADGRRFRMAYAARARREFAFLPAIERLAADQLTLHTDDTAGRPFDLEAYFRSLDAGTQVYMCGPKPMLKAGMAAAKALGWPRDRLAFELFYSVAATSEAPTAVAVPPPAPDGAFEVVLKSSGRSFQVPKDKSILDVLIVAGVDPMHDCQRGDCGVCQVGVVDGTPDHRDFILSESERAANKVMQICVSRSKSPRLVLDL